MFSPPVDLFGRLLLLPDGMESDRQCFFFGGSGGVPGDISVKLSVSLHGAIPMLDVTPSSFSVSDERFSVWTLQQGDEVDDNATEAGAINPE